MSESVSESVNAFVIPSMHLRWHEADGSHVTRLSLGIAYACILSSAMWQISDQIINAIC